MSTSRITTHVLDAGTGRPAADVAVELHARDGAAWSPIAAERTDADGRISRLGPDELPPGEYRLRFDTGAYFAAQSVTAFFPQVTVMFEVADGRAHHHVPLLVSPFGYTTYRGS